MMRVSSAVAVAVLVAATLVYAQQRPAVTPVTVEMLLKPAAEDWLMYSRTYDAQRFSPLNQITTRNVSQLREVFTKELPNGVQESIPIVYRGVMYVLLPGNGVQALDATTGALIWEHKRPSGATRAKTISIYEDMIFNSTPDGFIEALDARTGELRWETKSSGRLTAGTVVIEGKVITGRACAPRRVDCYLAAHDAKTGKEVWRFYTAAASNEPGGDTWGSGAPRMVAGALGAGARSPGLRARARHRAPARGTGAVPARQDAQLVRRFVERLDRTARRHALPWPAARGAPRRRQALLCRPRNS
jgi:glucose dehydrogenase